jgi:hypothetical protein
MCTYSLYVGAQGIGAELDVIKLAVLGDSSTTEYNTLNAFSCIFGRREVLQDLAGTLQST